MMYFYSLMNSYIVVVGGVMKFVLVINVTLILNVDVLKMNIVNGTQQLQMVTLTQERMCVLKTQIVINVNYGTNIVGNFLIIMMILIINVMTNLKNLLHQLRHVVQIVKATKCV